jgi:hypothetical protein
MANSVVLVQICGADHVTTLFCHVLANIMVPPGFKQCDEAYEKNNLVSQHNVHAYRHSEK